MGLTPTQRQIIAKARSLKGAPLDDAACAYLVAVIALDLGWSDDFGDLGLGSHRSVPDFFAGSIAEFDATGLDFYALFERLMEFQPAAETYFACLAHMYARRLKYKSILEHQPLPTMDQVGPRALLQYGTLTSNALAALLFWRKWMFDIDNRAGQETGYLFEPIIAAALGGTPASAQRSPIKRRSDPVKGRQVDCIREVGGEKRAYEIKLRVTIAASGQGRFGEELEFPDDCKASGYVPVLVVLDPTEADKLTALRKRFADAGGRSYVGADAWAHLENEAGDPMGTFLEKYVRQPMEHVLAAEPVEKRALPEIRLRMEPTRFEAEVAGGTLRIERILDADPVDEESGDDDSQDELLLPV